jgi:lipopolysaccharide heptosyltransferase II
MALLQALGIGDVPVSFAFGFGPDIAARVDAICSQEEIDSTRPFVCFSPATTWPTKLWAQDKAARLCGLLHEQCNAQVLLVGAADDYGRLDQVRSLAGPGARNLAGRLSLRELACLVSRADLMLSMDSGPMHIACAVGAPVVALFGPTAPWRTGPFGSGHSVVRRALACSPCFQRSQCPEGHHRCLRDITVEEVFAVCCNYIKTQRRPHKYMNGI